MARLDRLAKSTLDLCRFAEQLNHEGVNRQI